MSATGRLIPLVLLSLAWGLPAAGQIVFGPPVTAIGNAPHPYDGATADLDGDGFVDLVFGSNGHLAQVYFGDGRGHFGPATPTTPAIEATSIGLGDLDGDGHPELLTAPDKPGPLVLQVWTGLGGAAFSGPVDYAMAGGLPGKSDQFKITITDADGDADPDVIVAASSLNGVGDMNSLTALLNDGSGSLTSHVIVSGELFFGGEVADLDADGLVDAVYSTWDVPGIPFPFTTRLVLGQPGGGFVEAQTWPDSRVFDLVDLDRDGLLDLTTLGSHAFGSVHVHLGLGGGSFADEPPLELPAGHHPTALADFDGDAVPDLLLTHATFVVFPTWALWPGNGRGGFDASKVSYANREGIEPRDFIFAVDAVADGRLDIIDEGSQAFGLQVGTTPNWTYPAGSPQLDLGHAQFGRDGWPGTLVSGEFVPDELVTIELWAVHEDSPAFLVAGLTESFAPFKGGVMVPEPDALFGPISAGSGEILELEGRWPGGLPAGDSITLQWWIADPIAPQRLSASTAVRITQP